MSLKSQADHQRWELKIVSSGMPKNIVRLVKKLIFLLCSAQGGSCRNFVQPWLPCLSILAPISFWGSHEQKNHEILFGIKIVIKCPILYCVMSEFKKANLKSRSSLRWLSSLINARSAARFVWENKIVDKLKNHSQRVHRWHWLHPSCYRAKIHLSLRRTGEGGGLYWTR